MINTKTAGEIERLRVGGRRLARILEQLQDFTGVGTAVADINEQAKELIANEDKAAFYQYQPGGASRPYPDHVCVSVNDAIVHGIGSESDYVLGDGDVVSLDMGLTHKDLIADSATTFVVGDSSDDKDSLLSVCKQALSAGIEQAKPKNSVGDISAAIEEAVGSEYAIFRQLVGHGVGYSVHEAPTIPNVGTSGSGPKLPAGAVIAIEPMIGMAGPGVTQDDDGYTYRTADQSVSAHFEHTVAVTDEGPVVLTKPKQ
jgi:methionyl aminopeptidase